MAVPTKITKTLIALLLAAALFASLAATLPTGTYLSRSCTACCCTYPDNLQANARVDADANVHADAEPVMPSVAVKVNWLRDCDNVLNHTDGLQTTDVLQGAATPPVPPTVTDATAVDMSQKLKVCCFPSSPELKRLNYSQAAAVIEAFCDLVNTVGCNVSIGKQCEGIPEELRLTANPSFRYAIFNVTSALFKINNGCRREDEIDSEDCSTQLYDIFQACKGSGGTLRHFCGYGTIAPIDSNSRHDLGTFFQKRDLPPTETIKVQACAGCSPCVNNGSMCNPPNWSWCTGEERTCLVDQACDVEACLLAGNCMECTP